MGFAGPQAVTDVCNTVPPSAEIDEHDTLKYHLLGPSLTKAGQDSVDQAKVQPISIWHDSYDADAKAGF